MKTTWMIGTFLVTSSLARPFIHDFSSDCSKSDASTPPPDLPLPHYLRRDSAKSKVRSMMKSAVVSLRQAPPRFAAWVKRHGEYRRSFS